MIARIALITALLTSTFAVANDNWPEYRGPWSNGHSDSTGLPLKWDETTNIKWKTPIHGRGWASPVVFGDQVWVTTATTDGLKMSAICVHRDTGKVLFDKVIFTNKTVRPLSNSVNTYASPSPTIEDGRVYVHWGSYGTACIDTKTFKVLWTQRDLPCHHWRGPGSSPYIFEDLLICTYDGADHQYVAALNKNTGQVVWKTPRSTDYKDLDNKGKPKAGGDFRKAYGTPIVFKADGKTQLFSVGAKAAFSYDPRTGKENWTVTFSQHSVAARPLLDKDMMYVNTGYSRPVFMAVKLNGAKGDVTKTHVAWQITKNLPRRGSPVLVDGLIYMIDGAGIATCTDAKTGDNVWTQRVGGKYTSSPVYVDGRVYFFSEEGKTTVIAPGREYKELAVNQLGDGFMACPAVAGKAFFLRSKSHLYRVEK